MEEKPASTKSNLVQGTSLSEIQKPPLVVKKRKSFWIIGIIMLVLVVVAGYFLISQSKKQIAANKVYHVGILALTSFGSSVESFKAKMSELGYIENKNITYELDSHTIDTGAMQKSLDKFAGKHVDLVFTLGTPPTYMAKKSVAEKGIPLVFSFCNVEGNDLIESLQRPGNNLTGVRFPGASVTVKRLEFLTKIAPKARKILVAYDKTNPSALDAITELRPSTKLFGVTLVEVPLGDVASISADLKIRDESGNIGIDAILIMPEGLTQSVSGWSAIRDFAAKHKIPIGGGAAFEADDGAIFSYVPDNHEVGQLAAILADKILKGTPAGEIPIMTSESRLRINYATAQKFNVTVPESVLILASEIIR
jgi:putative tryptophan/tyrosine transport system substrate-binding protein